MKQVAIDSNTIIKYTDILTSEECDRLYNYTFSKTNNPVVDPNKVPWELEGKTNTLYYHSIDDKEVKDILISYRNKLAEELTKKEGKNIYPHLTTLVLWKPGQFMPRHVDDGNGYTGRSEQLGMRYMTSVTYLNDDFDGGYTYIKNDGVNDHTWRSRPELSFPNNVFKDYMSKPEKGATLAFYADDRNAHGVTKLETGNRIILSTWFTTDERYREPDDRFIDMDTVNAGQQAAIQQQKQMEAYQQAQASQQNQMNQQFAQNAQQSNQMNNQQPNFNQTFKPNFQQEAQQAQQAWRKNK